MVTIDGFWKGEYDFLLVFNGNFSSVTHSFRDNAVFLQTGSDVMVESPLGGAAYGYYWQILIARVRLPVGLQL
jgi:hypothetical protein